MADCHPARPSGPSARARCACLNLAVAFFVVIVLMNPVQAFHRVISQDAAPHGKTHILQAERLSSVGAHEAMARARRGASFRRVSTPPTQSMLQASVDEWKPQVQTTGTIPRFSALPESAWDYKQHGKDWGGTCATGMKQSPVDLHIEGLQEPEYRNLTNLYMNAFSGTTSLPRTFRPWKRGDIFYTYTHQFTDVEIYKTDKIFQVRAPHDHLTPLGAMFTTDTTEMYTAQHIFFHSPSEHTFQGEANRREIEMQIWHYSNDLISFESSKSVNHTTLPYLAMFAQTSLNLPDVEQALKEDQVGRTDPNLPSSHWRVLSLTFMSEELDQTSLAELKNLPSERLLSTLLSAEQIKSEAARPEKIQLPHPLNLQSLMMMLQLTNTEFFAYDGSTTMPDCQENVRWYVARQPLPVATETMLRFYKMLNPQRLKSHEERDGNFRILQNVEDNMHNEGNVFLVQGFPLQVLIANSLGFDTMAKMSKEGAEVFQGWFTAAGTHVSAYSSTLPALAVSLVLLHTFGFRPAYW